MSRPGRPPRSQQRLLTEEDEALWALVARGLKPLRGKKRIHRSTAKSEEECFAPSASVLPMPEPPIREPASLPELRKAQIRKPAVQQPQFDRREARKIASGRVEIEARLDLHGLRAGDAHAALRAFILNSFAQGRRNVLVITGKGEPRPADRFFQLASSERGVLRREVPLWLGEPGLREIIVGFTSAHSRHGGEGALYVQLRSRRRVRGSER